MMRSPCRDCGHHLAGKSKDCTRCRKCKRRLAVLEADDQIPLAGCDQIYAQPRGLSTRYGYGDPPSSWDLFCH